MCSCFAIWLPEPNILKKNVTDQLIIIKLVYTAKIVYKPSLYKNKNFCPAIVNFGPLWAGCKNTTIGRCKKKLCADTGPTCICYLGQYLDINEKNFKSFFLVMKISSEQKTK